jgi:hypothetical protein
MSLENVISEIEKINEEYKKMNPIYAIDRRIIDLEEFLRNILNYFKIAIRDADDFEYGKAHEFFYQKDVKFNYVEFLLQEIQPYLSLALKMSQDVDIRKALEENRISEEGMIKMIRNFIGLYRTGRKRRIPLTSSTFLALAKLKEKYPNILEYLREIKERGSKVKSMKDFANAIKKHDITRESLSKYKYFYKSYLKPFISRCSRATLYRANKDLYFVKNSYFYVKDALTNYEFYQKINENLR